MEAICKIQGMASNLLAMASNLLAMASNDGLQPTSGGLQPRSQFARSKVGLPIDGMQVDYLDTPGVGDMDVTPMKVLTLIEQEPLGKSGSKNQPALPQIHQGFPMLNCLGIVLVIES